MSDTMTKGGEHTFCPKENCPHTNKLICPHHGEEGACYTLPTEEEETPKAEKWKSRR